MQFLKHNSFLSGPSRAIDIAVRERSGFPCGERTPPSCYQRAPDGVWADATDKLDGSRMDASRRALGALSEPSGGLREGKLAAFQDHKWGNIKGEERVADQIFIRMSKIT